MAAPSRFRFKAEYALDKFGNPDEDADRRSFGFIPAYHKRPWIYSPYRVPNEYICSRLGEFIGLPVPPCVVTYNEQLASPAIFSMLNFNVDKHELPPIESDLFVKHMPREAAAVLMFDIWIVNADRHDENLTVDDVSKPSLYQVFDHDQALFGGVKDKGRERLIDLTMRLGMSGGSVTGNNRHCLLDWMDTPVHFGEWIHAIWSVPNSAIERLFRDVLKLELLSREECAFGEAFLINRKGHIQTLLDANREEFTNIKDWNPNGELFA